MARTSVEWTRSADGTEGTSWNPVRGCSHASPGCVSCYAERMAARFCGKGLPYEGLIRGGKWAGVARLVPAKLDEPLHWKKPRRAFVNSMSDLFHESLTFEQIDAVFGVMWACLYSGEGFDGHTFLLLTKRARRMREYLSEDRRAQWAANAARLGGGRDPDGIHDQVLYFKGPHPRIHLGVSVESNEHRWRIDELRQCPAAVRWVSAEPLLGELDLRRHFRLKLQPGNVWHECCCDEIDPSDRPCPPCSAQIGLDWVVCGCESGPRRRHCPIEHAVDLARQCRAAGVPFFGKQFSVGGLVSKDPWEWPGELRARMLPGDKW